jgi:hypothetical protein
MGFQRLTDFRHERYMFFRLILGADRPNTHIRHFFFKTKIIPDQLPELFLPESRAGSSKIDQPAPVRTRYNPSQLIVGECSPAPLQFTSFVYLADEFQRISFDSSRSL